MILIVDDNPVSITAARGLFKSLGISADTAESGEEALRKLRSQVYDLVLMDYMMPGMDGIETVIRLRQTEGEYFQKVPVIALTSADEADAVLQTGMNGYITKPLTKPKIKEIMETWLPNALIAGDVREPAAGNEGLPVLEGIDSAEGLRNSGSKELFIRLLGDFYKLIDIKADKAERALSAGDMRDLTVEVHALKNAARIIGASALSDSFAMLERLSEEGDTAAVKRELPAALLRYRGFKPVLKRFAEARGHKRRASVDEIAALLEKVISSLDSFNLDGADGALRALDGMIIPENCADRMERLKAHVADVAAEEAAEIAEAIIREIKTKMTIQLPHNS
ncbi:MAG: response regulator [Clostridiales bacterium]|jgi:CheY-like chemotaxis protein/HPt (histidine-containing phosphotransfer) domain-containing protein|nr:response regulator [Clostridiales bacterium]